MFAIPQATTPITHFALGLYLPDGLPPNRKIAISRTGVKNILVETTLMSC